MFKVSNTLFFIVIIFIPFFTLFCIAYRSANFLTFMSQYDIFKSFKFEKEFTFKSLSKNNLKIELKKYCKSNSQIYKKFFELYDSLITSIFFHFLFEFISIIFTCYKIYSFFHYKHEFFSLSINNISVNIALVIVNVIFIWEIFVNSILSFLCFKEIHIFDKIKKGIDYLGEKVTKIFVGFWVTIFNMFVLVFLDKCETNILIHFDLYNEKENFILSLIFFLIYQYVVTKILSLIFYFIFNHFGNLLIKIASKHSNSKIVYNKKILITKKYCYEYFKVTTFFVLVYLYGYFSYKGLSSMVLPSVIGVFFVLDTSFDKINNLKTHDHP